MRNLIAGLLFLGLLAGCDSHNGIGGADFVQQVATPTAEAIRFPVEVIRAPTPTPPTPTATATPIPTPTPIVHGPQTVIVSTELFDQTVAITVAGFVIGDNANNLIKNALGRIAYIFEEPGKGETYFLAHFTFEFLDGPPGEFFIVDEIRNFHVSQIDGVPAGLLVLPEDLRFPDRVVKRGELISGWVGGVINQDTLGVIVGYQNSELDPLTIFTFNCLAEALPNFVSPQITNLCF